MVGSRNAVKQIQLWTFIHFYQGSLGLKIIWDHWKALTNLMESCLGTFTELYGIQPSQI